MIFDIVIYTVVFLAIASGILVVTGKSPVTSALSLVFNFFCIAFLYLLMEAQFLAAIQVIVYAGAIMVLFLFVIMLLNLQEDITLLESFDLKKGLMVLIAAGFLLQVLYILSLQLPGWSSSPVAGQDFPDLGTAEAIGKALFTRFVFPFEMITVVLLAAVVGAVVLARKKVEND